MESLSSAEEIEASGGVGVSLRGVRREFRGTRGEAPTLAIEALDLSVEAGEFVAILGPSGCGKSTLLRLVAGLDRPSAGEVAIERGAEHEALDGDVAYVFQDAHLLPWRDVLGNVLLPLELLRAPADTRRARAEEVLETVGLADFARHYPAQLSGGMRMRVSLARTLVTRPRLLLLDEPFAALDEITRMALDDELRALWAETGSTVLFVTHSSVEAAFLAERAVVLSQRPARIVVDRAIELPGERTLALRADAGFARVVGELQAALGRASDQP